MPVVVVIKRKPKKISRFSFACWELSRVNSFIPFLFFGGREEKIMMKNVEWLSYALLSPSCLPLLMEKGKGGGRHPPLPFPAHLIRKRGARGLGRTPSRIRPIWGASWQPPLPPPIYMWEGVPSTTHNIILAVCGAPGHIFIVLRQSPAEITSPSPSPRRRHRWRWRA